VNSTLIRVVVFVCLFLNSAYFSSCSSSKKINTDYLYFRTGADTISTQPAETLIAANDLLSIQVYSKSLSQEQAAIFNIPSTAGSTTQGYQVNAAGNVEMPVIGAVTAQGLTKSQLQMLLAEKLQQYVKDPSVIVRFLEFNVNVLGEVHAPGMQKFNSDRVTIIDAISAAGDLTDYGKREAVTVIREENGKKIHYNIDLRSRAIFESPVYRLQPNDIVYVQPNNLKLKNMDTDQEANRKTGLFLAIISISLSAISLIITTLSLN